MFIYLHWLWKVDLSWVFFLPLLYFFIHYSIILSAGTTVSPRALYHLSPTVSKKSLQSLGPFLMANLEPGPLRLQLPLPIQLMDGQMVSRDTRYQALNSSEARSSSFCLQTLITHTSLPLYIWVNLLHPCIFARMFSAHLLYSYIGPCSPCQGYMSYLVPWERTLLHGRSVSHYNRFVCFASKWFQLKCVEPVVNTYILSINTCVAFPTCICWSFRTSAISWPSHNVIGCEPKFPASGPAVFHPVSLSALQSRSTEATETGGPSLLASSSTPYSQTHFPLFQAHCVQRNIDPTPLISLCLMCFEFFGRGVQYLPLSPNRGCTLACEDVLFSEISAAANFPWQTHCISGESGFWVSFPLCSHWCLWGERQNPTLVLLMRYVFVCLKRQDPFIIFSRKKTLEQRVSGTC